jgi:hypothetical protein
VKRENYDGLWKENERELAFCAFGALHQGCELKIVLMRLMCLLNEN